MPTRCHGRGKKKRCEPKHPRTALPHSDPLKETYLLFLFLLGGDPFKLFSCVFVVKHRTVVLFFELLMDHFFLFFFWVCWVKRNTKFQELEYNIQSCVLIS